MELLFVTLGGVILGLAARYGLPKRDTHGALLVPAIGAIVASVVWAALTWVGWKFDGGWIWVASLVAAGVIAGLASVFLGRQRTASDAELLTRLSRA
jgi:peptidoglycan/LPS O-acetylase OafA/YrhL